MKSKIYTTPVLFLLLLSILLVTVACTTQPAGNTIPDASQQGLEEDSIPHVEPVDLAGGRKLAVVATTTIIGDVAANLGGEKIDLTVLMAPGQDPHSYELTPRAVVSIQQADLVLVNGFGLEEALLDSIENNAAGVIVPVSAGIEALVLDDHGGDDQDHEHAGEDPHVWMDPNNVILWVDNIARVLAQTDPANRVVYEPNADTYRQELQTLDGYIREQVARIPAENRKLVTDHGLFNHFAEQYGFEVVGTVIPSFSSLAEPAASDIVALVEVIQQEGVNAIFIGATAGPTLQNLADAVAAETGREIKVLPLLTGSLAAPGQPGDTYLDYMRFNIDQIVLGLGE